MIELLKFVLYLSYSGSYFAKFAYDLYIMSALFLDLFSRPNIKLKMVLMSRKTTRN